LLSVTESLCIRSARDLNAPITIFEILQQDTDDVIMLINYYIEKGNYENNEVNGKQTIISGIKRIRVNNKTATGGWY
jgi:hypothetical protein